MFGTPIKQFAAGLLLAATFSATASADEQLNEIENAFQAADASTLTTLADAAQGQNQLVAQYRLTSLALGNGQSEKAHTLLTELKSDLETETGANPDNAEAWALLASTYGMLSAMEPAKAMDYGPRAATAEGRALTTGPNNPMALLLIGINKFYTPEEWGGGKPRALEYFERAVTAYEAGDLERTWGHADALVWRGSTHAKLGNKTQAKADIDAAIAMEPDYQWAQNALNLL